MKSQTPTLPSNTIFDILSRLPVKSLCRFRLVSKPWLELISDPHFIKSHLHQSNLKSRMLIFRFPNEWSYYSLPFHSLNNPVGMIKTFPDTSFNIFSSCYGILLVGDVKYNFSLWNPSTETYRKIPSPNNYEGRSFIRVLGYDSTKNDFKVVLVSRSILNDNEGPIHVHVFNSRTNSWKRIQDFPYCHKLLGGIGKEVVLEGIPHWDVRIWITQFHHKNVIMYFDPYEDTIKELPSPEFEGDIVSFTLTALGGNLCVVDHHRLGIDFWVMKESFWSRMLSLPRSDIVDFLKPFPYAGCHYGDYLKPLGFTGENDEEVFVVNNYYLMMLNLKQSIFKWTQVPPQSVLLVECYVESLVSPYAGLELEARPPIRKFD